MLLLLTAVLLASVSEGEAGTQRRGEFSFASYYNDHMVLQASPFQATVWGYSSQMGDAVKVEVDGQQPVSTTVRSVGGEGMWFVKLPVIPAGSTPYTVTATSSLGTIQLTDVLFGDVWICSGQSNMQFTLDMANNASAELQDSLNYPNIRVFTVQLNQSSTPLYDLIDVEEPWSVPHPVGHSPWSHFSAVCWLYGKYLYNTLKKPIGLVASSWGGTPIETWSTQDSLSKCRNESTQHVYDRLDVPPPRRDSVLWNAMIHPLVNMTIYGAIWYQGEANADKPGLYNCTFPAMIDDWRVKFNQASDGATSNKFPFGFVQLAADRNGSVQTGFPGVRWSQTAGFGYVPNERMKNVFMAVAMDLPDFSSPYGSVHPRDKQDVCQRLVRSGLSVAYNKPGMQYQGPIPDMFSYNTQMKYITVDYGFSGHTIDVRSSDGFEICCTNTTTSRNACLDPDHPWIPSPIKSRTTTSVTVTWTKQCQTLQAIRYAWQESPCPFKQCAVYWEQSKLPAPPILRYL
ncbi:sialate O-acetylesterase-like isoform X2 [Haliotis rubra]|uniref:sialate O-acetylesterase-like isoform X2 n=1 Tax=Haliotis rubra TaxID=36100 RepID=UPI001EE55807|nr:sialate O-acetylesterase-like isoform X2 [Haliotis rubra]